MDRDKGKEEALKPLEGIKRKKMENTSDGQDAEAASGMNKEETEAPKVDTDVEFEEILQGEKEYSTELSTSEDFDVLCSTVLLSPKGSSTNNPPKGIKKIKNVVQDEELILSPKESSTNNPKGMKRVREEEEEEEEEDKEKKLKAADSLSDTGTSKFPTSPIDKFMDSSYKDDQSMQRSPPGDL